jgi:Rieske Fe-S protein
MNRRTALSWITGGLAALLAGVAAVPLVARVLAPLAGRDGKAGDWVPVARVADLPPGRPTRVAFPVTRRDGWVVETIRQAAWVVPDEASDGGVRVLSTICPHLGCSIAWKPSAAHFACPCHDSEFAPGGDRRHGPARRGMDPLPHRVNAGMIEVRWLEYAAGTEDRHPLGAA